MIISPILQEKDRVQAKLARESSSIHEYLVNAQIAAQEIANLRGFSLKYVEIPNQTLQQKYPPLSY
jgi:hypothetical protein